MNQRTHILPCWQRQLQTMCQEHSPGPNPGTKSRTKSTGRMGKAFRESEAASLFFTEAGYKVLEEAAECPR